MTVTVASTDIANYALQAQITAVQVLVNAPTVNPAQVPAYLAQLTALQIQLINNLMANAFSKTTSQGGGPVSWILPATVLSTLSVNA